MNRSGRRSDRAVAVLWCLPRGRGGTDGPRGDRTGGSVSWDPGTTSAAAQRIRLGLRLGCRSACDCYSTGSVAKGKRLAWRTLTS